MERSSLTSLSMTHSGATRETGISLDIELSPRSTINHLPDELLVEIFDFYRQHNFPSSHSWSIKLEWFKLIHVCNRWRTVMFASSSRLDLYFVLGSNQEGDMKTIMSRHSPPLPIEINYNRWVESLTTKEMGRILAALKCPDRILGFTLTGSADDLNKIFKATARRPFPALESLALRDGKRKKLKIPATFLKESDLHLRTLKLQHVSLPSISRFLSSAPALTDLSLVLDTDVGPPLAMSLLLSYLQGMHYLRRLELDTTSEIDGLVRPTKPEERFPLAKLTFFHYRGHSAFLNTLVAGIVAPAVREIDIDLYDIRALPPITDLPRFIDDIGERYHAVQVSIDRDCFHFSLFTQSEYVGRHSPHLKLCTDRFFESVMHTSNAFSAKLTTAEELILIFVPMANIPWHSFLQHFPSVKALRMPGSYNPHISSVLHQDYEGLNLAFLPALEEIEIFQSPFCYHESERVAELAAFEPFVSARQQAGFQVKVVNSNRAFNDVCR